MKSVILGQHGRSFSATVGKAGLWHMTVPFGMGVIYDRQWSMQLPNGEDRTDVSLRGLSTSFAGWRRR